MSDDLFHFVWPVYRRGYRWITTRSIEQPTEPEPISEEATPRERLDYQRALVDSRPRQFLTTGVPTVQLHDKTEVRHPLRDFGGRLHRVFAAVEPTPGGILEFANNFGMLGDVDDFIPLEEFATEQDSKVPLGIGEELGKWIGEIQDIRLAATVWDWLHSNDEKALSEHFEWKDHAVLFRWEKPDRKLAMTALHRELNPSIMERIEPGNNLVPALKIVQTIVNDHLSRPGRATPKLMHNIDTDRLEHHIVPKSLIGAIWLDFALSVDGNKEYRKCVECGSAFPAGGRGQKKRFCSDKCRVANYRHRKEAQSGATI